MRSDSDGDRGSSPDDALEGGRYRVLVVDDDPTMLSIIEAMLRGAADVVSCTSGLQATMLLRQRTFEVVCSDYLMPGMDGVAVLRAAADAQEDASLLLVTGGADLVPEAARKRYYVMQKPLERDRLVRLVAQLARIARMKRSVKASASRLSALPERSSWPPPSTPTPTPPPPPPSTPEPSRPAPWRGDGARRSEMPPRRSEVPARRSEIPPRRSEVPTRRSEVPTRRSEVPTRRSEVPTRRSETPPRRSEVPPSPSPRPKPRGPRS